ncbi:MAG: hypothetical protein EXR71_18685 [Myxococcales bacterium]|nr:hypothetical protein [Myxococcales bacterium]
MNLLLSAIEPSADRMGAELLAELSRRGVAVRARGLGGPLLRAQGLVPVAPLAPAAMGVVEVLRHLRALRRQRSALVEAARVERPDLFLCIDAPDFHIPVATALRRRGIRTVGWVSPQLWAWRPGRARAVARAYDELLCLFPFEPALYAGTTLRAVFVGHGAIDRGRPRQVEAGTVALFPGSRPAEVARLLPPFLAATRGYARVLVAEAPGVDLRASLPEDGRLVVVQAAEAIARCERALSKSGTVTLELALSGVPTVVAHRVHPLTWLVGRLLVRGIRFLALPNILLDREVCREFVQRFTPDDLSAALGVARAPPAEELRALVGPAGVVTRVADRIT